CYSRSFLSFPFLSFSSPLFFALPSPPVPPRCPILSRAVSCYMWERGVRQEQPGDVAHVQCVCHAEERALRLALHTAGESAIREPHCCLV
ncbi:hypothetical protein B0H13DRAFT_2081874, partial [Mycena leptocephala]